MSALSVDRLTKRYRNGTVANLSISLAIEPGEIYGLLGPNGAGKTTLVRQVLGLLKPTSGTISVGGADVVRDPGFARRNIAFLPQGQFNMEGARVDEMILAVAKLRGLDAKRARERTEQVISELELEPFRRTVLVSASGGVARLTGFATAIVAEPRFLVLDEPTNDIDPIRRQLLWNVLAEMRRSGTTVLLVTHNLAEAERVLDRLAIIDRGRIVQEGSPAQLRSLVTHRLRLEMTGNDIEPHDCLLPDPGNPGAFLLDMESLPAVTRWLGELRERGTIVDFRIGPPTLDDIYGVALASNETKEVA